MIAIFDSGAGGVFVLQKLIKSFSSTDFIYLADKASFPYGPKKPDLVRKITKKNLDFLAKKGAKNIIIACNTASATIIKKPFSTSSVPVTEIISSSLKTAYQKSFNKKTGVLATTGTVKSKAFLAQNKNLSLGLNLYQKACPLLAPLIEEKQKNFTSKKDYLHFKFLLENPEKLHLNTLLRLYIDPLLKKEVSAIILGCTHYLYLKPFISEYIKKVFKCPWPVSLISPVLCLSKEIKKNTITPKKSKKIKQQIKLFITHKNYNKSDRIFKEIS